MSSPARLCLWRGGGPAMTYHGSIPSLASGRVRAFSAWACCSRTVREPWPGCVDGGEPSKGLASIAPGCDERRGTWRDGTHMLGSRRHDSGDETLPAAFVCAPGSTTGTTHQRGSFLNEKPSCHCDCLSHIIHPIVHNNARGRALFHPPLISLFSRRDETTHRALRRPSGEPGETLGLCSGTRHLQSH